MVAKLTVLGVHSVEADEPCHIIELLVEGFDEELDFGEITQDVDGQPRDNWQVPWDERELGNIGGKRRYAFFFHFLDLDKPLLTPIGSVPLPNPSNVPNYLRDIEYEAP